MLDPTKYLHPLKAIDFVTIAYCIFMIVLVGIFGHKLNDRMYIIQVYLGCFLACIIFIFLRKINNAIIGFFTTLYPLILIIFFYELAGHQIHLFFNGFFDKYILLIENAIFSVHPTIWLERFNHPLVTDWMMFAYSGYVLLIPLTAGHLYITKKYRESENMVLSLLLSFFICYIIFSIFPVLGPRFVMADQYTVTYHSYIFKHITDLLEAKVMLYGGAFPSAHCSAATVMLILSYRYDRKLFYWILPVIITLYISTIYGRYHYPLDVVAGIITGITGIKLSLPVERLWRKFKTGTNN
jgi:membrane-associated phospholipid phosphatase